MSRETLAEKARRKKIIYEIERARSADNMKHEQVIECMKQLGWEHEELGVAKRKKHIFRRPDGSGLVDVVRVPHAQMNAKWFRDVCIRNEADCEDAVNGVFGNWLVSKGLKQ